MTDCHIDCQCHVSPITHVPCCPKHHLPLHAAEAGNGQCPWVGPASAVRDIGGVAHYNHLRCITWGPVNWLWRPRDMFNGEDLPPYNGHQPPRYPSPGAPTWEFDRHYCKNCRIIAEHVFGDNRSVCTSCGAATWVPDPQYVNVGDAL